MSLEGSKKLLAWDKHGLVLSCEDDIVVVSEEENHDEGASGNGEVGSVAFDKKTKTVSGRLDPHFAFRYGIATGEASLFFENEGVRF